MGEEFSVCSVVNFYENGKHIGYSLPDGEIVFNAEEEPLEVPDLFPKKQEIRDKEDVLRGAVRFPDEDD